MNPKGPLRKVIGEGGTIHPTDAYFDHNLYEYLECGHQVRMDFGGAGGVHRPRKRARCKACGQDALATPPDGKP